MDRRQSLKTLFLGTAGGAAALAGCRTETNADALAAAQPQADYFYGRTPQEKARDERIQSETFFREHELETLTVLADLILPASEFGGIREAKVPEFIEFMAKDMPAFQLPLRGGVMALDHRARERYGRRFVELDFADQKPLLDDMAFYDAEVPEAEQPQAVQFFDLVRGLTMTGYWTSPVGIEDLGYKGNGANLWDGVPQEVLDKHGVAYDEEWLAKCIDHDTRETIAEWDDEGNLIA